MIAADIIIAAALGYVALLFAVAYLVDRRCAAGEPPWMRSGLIYTLSISVYCTAWTFYGAVGSAARSGLDFVAIYLGPTLVFVGWLFLLRKLARTGRANRVTSIADWISARFGKSPALAVMVTLIATAAITPYISLQLQSITRSYAAITNSDGGRGAAFWIAVGMAAFTILFGTRNADVQARHHGVIAAIAVEAVVKLVALIAVGLYVVYGLSDGFADALSGVDLAALSGDEQIFDARWTTLVLLSAAAVICLPRQFQVMVVENADERQIGVASWAFPLYLFAMSVFIMPIAAVGLKTLPPGSNPDLFVLTLPLSNGRGELSLLAFIGGFSSATSMIIVATIAVSTMLSNHVIMPIALRFPGRGPAVSGDVRKLLLAARRGSIIAVLALGFGYLTLSGGADALAAIGLISFAGVAQFLPAVLGGLFWRGATRQGAIAGLAAGAVVWGYTLFLPGLAAAGLVAGRLMEGGPFGFSSLAPHALLGDGDALVAASALSLGLNAALFVAVSALTRPSGLEQLQAERFIAPDQPFEEREAPGTPQASVEALFVLAQRILGAEPARALFERLAAEQGRLGGLPRPTGAVVARLEAEFAGTIGAASAHAMVGRIAAQRSVDLPELFDIADETQRLIETSRRLEQKSGALEAALGKLSAANARLRALDAQKDDFLSQVSHELRTPMTAIRSFAEILLEDEAQGGVTEAERRRFTGVIHDESLRLTRLLDEILDASRLEAGAAPIAVEPVALAPQVLAAVESVAGMTRAAGVTVTVENAAEGAVVAANTDRLRQVLINLLTNAVKYNDTAEPKIWVTLSLDGGRARVDVRDSGGGVPMEAAEAAFEKFSRGPRATREPGAGLGLPISRAIMRAMGGELSIEPYSRGGTLFRITALLSPTGPSG